MATTKQPSPTGNPTPGGSGHAAAPAAPGLPRGVELRGPLDARQREVVSNGALELVADLVRRFGWRVDELLARRRERQARLDAGELPDFLAETAHVRAARLDGGAAAARPPRPPRRDHRARSTAR